MHPKDETILLRKITEQAGEDFREIFELSEDAICIADPGNGHIIKMNGRAATLLNDKKDPSIPVSVTALPCFSATGIQEKIKACFTEGPQRFEWEGFISGRFHRLLITLKPTGISGPGMLLIFLRQLNISSGREEISETERKNKEALLESISDQIWSVDSEIRLITANKAFFQNIKNITGIEPKPGDRLLQYNKFPEDYISFWRELYATAFRGESFVKEVYRPAIEGVNELWREISFHPIFDGDRVTGIVCYSKDITAQKEANRLQSLLVSIVDSSTDAIISKNLDGIITSWNKGAERLYGYTAEEMIGRHLSVIIPGEYLQEDADMTDRINRGEYVEPFETKRLKKDGSLVDVMITISPILDGNGRVIGASKTVRDFTERKKTEEALSKAYEEKVSILESIGDAFFALDKNWTVMYWNKKAEELTKVPTEMLLNRHLLDVFSASENPVSVKNYTEAFETNTARTFEDYFAPMNLWVEISAYPSDAGLSVYFKDITDRKNADLRLKEINATLQKQTRDLATSNAELEQFAYVASHDLQEPLRMVTSFLTQLEKKYYELLDEKGKKYIGFAVDGAKRMREMILDLLEFSRVGRIEERREKVNINELIEEIRILFRKKIEEKKAVITSDPLPVLLAAKAPLRQVFQNLISNSLKYTAADVHSRIHIGAKELHDEWEFTVADNGIGIDSEFFSRIFIIFQRLHNRDEYSGTGMGLAIAKKIIEAGGGSIRVASEEGKGSCFYFTVKK